MRRKGSGTAGMELDWPITMGSECKDCWKGPEMSAECAGIAWDGPEWTTPSLCKCKKNDQIRLTSTRKHPTNLRTKSENKSKKQSEKKTENKSEKQSEKKQRTNQRENLRKNGDPKSKNCKGILPPGRVYFFSDVFSDCFSDFFSDLFSWFGLEGLAMGRSRPEWTGMSSECARMFQITLSSF